MFSASRSSSKDCRKARVDSAPRFSLGRSGCKTIATSTCGRIVDREIQVVATEEPFKGALGFLAPTSVTGDAIGLKTGRHHCLTFHGLLIEAGAFTALFVEAIGSDRDKMATFAGPLYVGQPAQRFQPGLDHLCTLTGLSTDERRVWQDRVAVGQAVFVPSPVIRTARR